LADADLSACLDDFDTRQVLHVTYGSVLAAQRGLRMPLLDTLRRHAGEYSATLQHHLERHLASLAAG
jgi:hypothetical protein